MVLAVTVGWKRKADNLYLKKLAAAADEAVERLRREPGFRRFFISAADSAKESLHGGLMLKKHRHRRAVERLFYLSPGCEELCWSSPDNAELDSVGKHTVINPGNHKGKLKLMDIRAVRVGITTRHFSVQANEYHSVSIVARKRTVDLELANCAERDRLASMIRDLLIYRQVPEKELFSSIIHSSILEDDDEHDVMMFEAQPPPSLPVGTRDRKPAEVSRGVTLNRKRSSSLGAIRGRHAPPVPQRGSPPPPPSARSQCQQSGGRAARHRRSSSAGAARSSLKSSAPPPPPPLPPPGRHNVRSARHRRSSSYHAEQPLPPPPGRKRESGSSIHRRSATIGATSRTAIYNEFRAHMRTPSYLLAEELNAFGPPPKDGSVGRRSGLRKGRGGDCGIASAASMDEGGADALSILAAAEAGMLSNRHASSNSMTSTSDDEEDDEEDVALLELINAQRLSYGLSPVALPHSPGSFKRRKRRQCAGNLQQQTTPKSRYHGCPPNGAPNGRRRPSLVLQSKLREQEEPPQLPPPIPVRATNVPEEADTVELRALRSKLEEVHRRYEEEVAELTSKIASLERKIACTNGTKAVM